MLGRGGRASQGNRTCCEMTLNFQDAVPGGCVLPELFQEGEMKENWYGIHRLLATLALGLLPKGHWSGQGMVAQEEELQPGWVYWVSGCVSAQQHSCATWSPRQL